MKGNGINWRFYNKTVFIDTSPLIYFIEGHSQFQNQLLKIFKANEKGQVQFQTSTLTLLEILVQPLRYNRPDLVEKYEEILTNSPYIEIYQIDLYTSKKAAELRANYNLKTPDAIQLATSIQKKADFFWTNDKKLKQVKEIEIRTLEEWMALAPNSGYAAMAGLVSFASSLFFACFGSRR